MTQFRKSVLDRVEDIRFDKSGLNPMTRLETGIGSVEDFDPDDPV
jgi:hypothetical protein